MTDTTPFFDERPSRVLMLGTFGLRPKGTMSARAIGIAAALKQIGWDARIVTVPWDSPRDAGTSGSIDRIPYTNTRIVRPALWPIAVAEIINYARQFSPDLIHLFKPKGFGDLAARALRRRGYPVVVDMDDWEGTGGWNDVLSYSRLQRRVFDWQEESWPAMAEGVIVASAALRQRAIDLGAREDSILYLPNRLTSSRMAELAHPAEVPTKDYPIPPAVMGKNILLYTRFVEFPPEFPVDVLVALKSLGQQANLVIAGTSADGTAEKRLFRYARSRNVDDRISLLGWIDPQDLGWIAKQCDAALVPFGDTLINRSKCSVKLLELVACGIPVVASNVGENRPYLAENDDGYLAKPGSVEHHAEQLSAALRAVPVSDRSDAQTMCSVIQEWTWERAAGQIEAHYVESMSRALMQRQAGARR